MRAMRGKIAPFGWIYLHLGGKVLSFNGPYFLPDPAMFLDKQREASHYHVLDIEAV
jgi:hypothetical protein